MSKEIQSDNDMAHEIQVLALSTFNWAVDEGCIRRPDDLIINRYFIVKRHAKDSNPLIWEDQFGQDPKKIWPKVKNEMLRLGFSLCMDSRRGHYIGLPGEQAVNVSTQVNHVVKRCETIRKTVEQLMDAKLWDIATPYIQGRLRDGMKEVDVLELCDMVDQVLTVANIPHQISMGEYLLRAGKNNEE